MDEPEYKRRLKDEAQCGPSWFGRALAIAQHLDEMAEWPWWARWLHKTFVKCECCAAKKKDEERWKKRGPLTFAIIFSLTATSMAGSGDIINYGPAAHPDYFVPPIQIAYHSASHEPRWQAMLDEKDMKALIFIEASRGCYNQGNNTVLISR